MIAIPCIGPGPHTPADAPLGEVEDGEQVPRAMCGACAERLPVPPPSDPTPVLDVLALAAELDVQRARLEAAEDALDHLIVSSLTGDL